MGWNLVNSLSIFSSRLYSSPASIPEVEESRLDPSVTALSMPEGPSGTGARDDFLWAGAGRSRIMDGTTCPRRTGPSLGDCSSASGMFAAAASDGDGGSFPSPPSPPSSSPSSSTREGDSDLKNASDGLSGSRARRPATPPFDAMCNAVVYLLTTSIIVLGHLARSFMLPNDQLHIHIARLAEGRASRWARLEGSFRGR